MPGMFLVGLCNHFRSRKHLIGHILAPADLFGLGYRRALRITFLAALNVRVL